MFFFSLEAFCSLVLNSLSSLNQCCPLLSKKTTGSNSGVISPNSYQNRLAGDRPQFSVRLIHAGSVAMA